MSEKEETNAARQDHEDELSDAASSRAEEESLRDEELPSYQNENATGSSAPPPEKSATGPAPIGPTTSSPFNFPSPPTYTPSESSSQENQRAISKLLAIPQTTPIPTAPFLSSYPPALLQSGISQPSWSSFLETLSAFISAKVSQQALHHATDLANNIGEYHKNYSKHVKNQVRGIGESAKKFNPFGVVGGAIGLTLGGAFHAVGSVLTIPGAVIRKPKTPRERAEVYLAAANKDWFLQRGLQALLLDTNELCTKFLNISSGNFLGAVKGNGEAREQMASLREWIGEVEILAGGEQDEASKSSKAAGKKPWNAQLQIGTQTLWLVIMPIKFSKGAWRSDESVMQ